MSIIYKKDRKKPYYFSFSTGQKLANGSYKRIHSDTGYATKEEAEAAEMTAKLAIRNGTYVEPTKMTVAEMLEKFLATKVEIRPSTRIQYQASINHIKEHPLADRPLQKAGVLAVEDCRKFLYDQVDSGRLSMSTIREDLSFLCSAFTWAADVDLIYKSPARRLKLPPKTKPQGIHTPVENIMEILRIVKIESYDTLYIPLLLAGFCGLRISEICGIQLDKISADGIKVENNLCRVRNKPGVVNADGTVSKVQLAPLKTESSYRIVPIASFVWQEVSAYIKYLGQCKKEAYSKRYKLLNDPVRVVDTEYLEPAWQNDKNLLYVFPDNGRRHLRDFVERKWRNFKKSNPTMLRFLSKYPELQKMRLHDFRHSFGSNLRDQGVSVEDICELLGHNDAEFTRRTYALPLENTHKKAIDFYEEKLKRKLVNFL